MRLSEKNAYGEGLRLTMPGVVGFALPPARQAVLGEHCGPWPEPGTGAWIAVRCNVGVNPLLIAWTTLRGVSTVTSSPAVADKGESYPAGVQPYRYGPGTSIPFDVRGIRAGR